MSPAIKGSTSAMWSRMRACWLRSITSKTWKRSARLAWMLSISLRLLLRDQAIHPPGDHERGAEGDGEDDGEQEEAGLALHRQGSDREATGRSSQHLLALARQIGPFRRSRQGEEA